MPTYDASQATCHVFTFKEGLLSAVAHDLVLEVRTLEIQIADNRSSVSATFDVPSIRVIDAIVDGRRSPGTLSDKDKKKIEANVVSDVFGKSNRTVRFTSSQVGETEVRGKLSLAGREREVRVPFREDGDFYVGEVTLHQPDFGIKPFSAMLGTLKIKPDVRVELRVPR